MVIPTGGLKSRNDDIYAEFNLTESIEADCENCEHNCKRIDNKSVCICNDSFEFNELGNCVEIDLKGTTQNPNIDVNILEDHLTSQNLAKVLLTINKRGLNGALNLKISRFMFLISIGLFLTKQRVF